MSEHARYSVVTNIDGFYSIWPEGRELPDGWQPEGMVGTEDECSTYVDRVWTWLTPSGLRERRA